MLVLVVLFGHTCRFHPENNLAGFEVSTLAISEPERKEVDSEDWIYTD